MMSGEDFFIDMWLKRERKGQLMVKKCEVVCMYIVLSKLYEKRMYAHIQ